MPVPSCVWTVVAISTLCAPAPNVSDLTEVRKAFLEVERIARLTEAEQRQHVARLYELTTFLIPRYYAMAPFLAAPPADGKNPPTPEERANVVEAKGGWAGLHSEARTKCLNILRRHLETLEPLVAADFASGEEARVGRALTTAGELRLKNSFADVLKVFQGTSSLSQQALYTLRDLGDQRAIPAILDKNRDRPTEHFEVLRSLCRKGPADLTLVRLMDDTDPRVRFEALYALAECGDESLTPKVSRLFEDADPQVRQAAANLAVNLSDRTFQKLRPGLLELLSDPDRQVRFSVALYFAHRRDKACGPALLALLREAQLQDGYHSTAVQAMHTLTGSYFGYQLGEKPSTFANQAALDGFGKWIAENKE